MNNSLVQENDFLKQCIKIYMEGCKERQERIDKAIEYIKRYSNNCMFELRIEEMEELLEILGDKE